jgi:hypothetical protein
MVKQHITKISFIRNAEGQQHWKIYFYDSSLVVVE